MSAPPRLLVIGLDGATLDLIEPWAAQGRLPVMAELMAAGSYARLRSVMPVLSSAAWSSFMTGKNPGKHSLYDFVRREPESYRLRVMTHTHLRAPTLWRLLGDHGRRVGVVNVPMTYPPEAVNGFLVSGLGTPDYKPFTHPPELGNILLERGYQVNKRVNYSPQDEAAYLQELHAVADRQLEAAVWLMQSQPWDFFINVFFDTDQVGHYFWRYLDGKAPAAEAALDQAILGFYQSMDRAIGRLRAAAGPDVDVIVLSDHGMGPYRRDVFLNEWLRQEGYLAVLEGGETQVASLHGPQRLLARLGLTREGVSAGLRRRGLGRLERWIKDRLGDRIELLPRSRRAEFPQAIDWSRTRAYSFGYQGQIYINLAGREPQGIVAPGQDCERLCAEISQKLAGLVDPLDGLPVVDRVYRKEEIFHGPYTGYAPDLTLIMRGLAYNTRPGYEFSAAPGRIFAEPAHGESGSHRPEGILIAAGPGIAAGGRREAASLIDLAPTILHHQGCPVPDDMDGRVLADWLTAGIQPEYIQGAAQRAESGAASLSAEDEAEIIARLKSLGYLE